MRPYLGLLLLLSAAAVTTRPIKVVDPTAVPADYGTLVQYALCIALMSGCGIWLLLINPKTDISD